MISDTEFYEAWVKTASEKGLISELLSSQFDAHKAMRSEQSPVVADPELIKKRIYESFKLGILMAALAAASGAALGMPLGVSSIGAALGGYAGLLGGTIKGQADVNKKYLEDKGFKPQGINLLRYAVPDQSAAYLATTILPESGYLKV
jgi:hypothetical protein